MALDGPIIGNDQRINRELNKNVFNTTPNQNQEFVYELKIRALRYMDDISYNELLAHLYFEDETDVCDITLSWFDGQIITAIDYETSNNIYILDIQKYIWVTSLNSANPSQPTVTNLQTSVTDPDNKPSFNNVLFIGIGIGVGGIMLIGILSFVSLILYKKWYQKSEIIPTPGSILP
ncbi:13267_t:CDS:2 [Dentiscutata heterogama]|uniref:13267_t:CDS:1 n=1 Tax=Dentiscutata heterogama TaxID=1316150 RepID=A0ACA9KA90_9GLOM|nr:13267_t:CDS:2 [Dentiscutata heterogama]